MKKIIVGSALALMLVVAPLAATAQTTSLPGSTMGGNIQQLTQLVELLSQLLELQEQLAEIQAGGEATTISGESGEVTTESEQEVSVSNQERNYIATVATCATNRIDNAQQVWKTKDDFAKFSTAVLNLPRISLQKKFEKISDRNTEFVQPEFDRLEGELKAIDADCRNTIQPVEGVTAASSTPVTRAIEAIAPQITKLESDLATNNALPICTSVPLTPESAGLSQIKKTVLTEQCKAKSNFFKAQIDALTKQKKSLESI